MQINYDDDMLQQINAGVDLLEYVSQSIEMKRRGNDYFGRCPLHIDKTPSFSITPEKNSYYCFSCGKSGQIISYLINYEKLSFDEAVNKAARLANVDMSLMCRSKTMTYLKRVRNVMHNKKPQEEHVILDESVYKKYPRKIVPEWLNEGIRQDVLDRFDIRVDDYSNRIIYPVRDIDGRLINIKGRTRFENYKAMRLAKYINFYPVGTVDYFQGLDITKPHIESCREIIIFESIKSVMKAYGWGFKNCVSAEKHTLTDEQIKLLVKLRVNVVFAYDSDVDYRKGATRDDIDKLKRVTNVYVINDSNNLLGGIEAKNAPVDCGEDVWRSLYENKRKIV